jgi:hypothetical protein
MNQSKNIDKKQYLRYMKTFVWAAKQPTEVLLEINKKGQMEKYPVSANTVEDAINFIETGDNLAQTNISQTDIYAIMEVVKHRLNEEKAQEGEGK